MKLNGNTILITGGGSGIGRGLAEALHKLGNKIIVSGRRRKHLDDVVAANPGIEAIELDITSAESVNKVAKEIIAKHPSLNVLINNAGMMEFDNAAAMLDDAQLLQQVTTNLIGPLRVASAFVEHLKKQPSATIIYNSSVVAFTPFAPWAVYSATKAALHSYALSQRYLLKDTTVRVQEIAPPWVDTGLAGGKRDSRAMPLDKFIAETMKALGTEAEEILVEDAKQFRNNAGPNEHAFVEQFNTMLINHVLKAA